MPTFEVSLARSFVVKIQAQTAKDAATLSEFFLGYGDASGEQERKEHQFEFREINMVDNDVLGVNEIEG